ncbi:unnamed protein product [Candida verbasci]|uniref:Dolichyl-diphosphooligosaccharide--protein glycosyltransferase subunit WBP1 n=1 Tax=Candida verbasci TaxID=1227364 RepID=A0A9W4XG18_9ASCO|nr:unnamed protein product [Candida verbasci]
MIKQFYILLNFLYFTIIFALDIGIEQTLVLHDPEILPLNDSTSGSNFLKYLDSNFELTFADYNNDEISLFYNDEESIRFDNIILFPSSKKTINNKKNLNQHNLLKFINLKGNVLVIGGSESTSLPEPFRIWLNELGIYPAPKNYKYIDHFNTKLSEKNNLIKNNIVDSLKVESYDGSAALITNNELIFPIISSSKTGYTNKVGTPIDQESTWTFGTQGYLAVAFQALNNARVAWIGSIDLLNQVEIYEWVFQKKNTLRLQFAQHVNNEDPSKINPTLYRIKDQAIYTIGISEFKNGQWVPFEIGDGSDLTPQLSFKMLDPYQKLNLEKLGKVSSKEKGDLDTFAYFVNFTVPDHHGMFTFELDYKRHGYSWILDKKIVTVRHLANDEFKRSWDITNSWLYIASTLLVIIAWFLFVVNYIYVGKVNYKKKDQ